MTSMFRSFELRSAERELPCQSVAQSRAPAQVNAVAPQGPCAPYRRPVKTVIDDGVPQILAIRTYLDALRGGT